MKWSDGQPINASDLAFSLQIYMPNGPYANASAVALYGGGIPGILQKISIINSTSILITLNTKRLGFPVSHVNYDVYPWHYMKQFHGFDALEKTPILSGPMDSPYIPVNYTGTGNTMLMQANPLSPAWNGTQPNIPKIAFQYFTDTGSMINALVAGTIDMAQVPYGSLRALQSYSSLTVVNNPNVLVQQLSIRSSGYPFSESAFRKALLHLVNVTQINSVVYNGQAIEGNAGLMFPTATTWIPSNLAKYNYDPALAQQLFAKAGLTKNGQGLLAMANGTVLPPFTFEGTNADPAYIRAEQLIASSWQSAGLQVTFKSEDSSAINNNIFANMKYDVVYSEQQYFPNPFRYLQNRINWQNGIGGTWENATFSAQLKGAQTANDLTTAHNLMEQGIVTLSQNAIVEGIVYTPIYVAYNNQVLNNLTNVLQESTYHDLFALPYTSPTVLTSMRLASPLTATVTSTTTATSTAISTTTATSISTASAISTAISTVTTTATTTTSAGLDVGTLSAIAAVVVILVVAVAVVAIRSSRRRPSGPTT